MAARSYANVRKWTKKPKTWDTASSDLFDAVVSTKSRSRPGERNWILRSPKTSPAKSEEESAMEKARIAYRYSHSPGSKASVGSSKISDPLISQEAVSQPPITTGAKRKISQKRKLTESLKVFDFASDDEDEGRGLEEEGEGSDGRAEVGSANRRPIKRARGIAQARGQKTKAKVTPDSQNFDAISETKASSKTKSGQVKAVESGRKKSSKDSGAKSVSKTANSRKYSQTGATGESRPAVSGAKSQSRTTKRKNSRVAETDPGDAELPSKRAKASRVSHQDADSEDIWGSQNVELPKEDPLTPTLSQTEAEDVQETETERMPYINMYPGRSRVTRGFVRMLASQESDLESPSLTTSDLESQTSEEVTRKNLSEKGAGKSRQPRAKARVHSVTRGNPPLSGWSDSETENSQESQDTVEKQSAKVVVRPAGSPHSGIRSVVATSTDSITPVPCSSSEVEWLHSSQESEAIEVSEDPLVGVRSSGTQSSRSQESSWRTQTQETDSTAEPGRDDGMETDSTAKSDFDTTSSKQLVSESSIECQMGSQSSSGSQRPAESSKSGSEKVIPVIEVTDDMESDTQPVNCFLEETPNLSLSEPADRPAFSRQFERHLYAPVPSLKKASSGVGSSDKAPPLPSLTRSSTWPKSYSASGAPLGLGGAKGHGVKCIRGEKELVMVVRNVKQAHECLELGENQQFFDEMEYLLESLRPHQSTSLRGLGMCNLAQQCLSSSFSQQIRAHGFTSKITALLGDCLKDPTLCIAAAVLMYVMTRDRLNSDWSKEGIELLVNMLAMEGEGSRAEFASLEAELSSKARREFIKVKGKASSVLQKVQEALLSRDSRPSKEGAGDKGEAEEEEGGMTEKGEGDFCVDPENFSISELSRECLLSLTSPHHPSHPHPSHQHNPYRLREDLRILGGLDHFTNSVISACTDLEAMDLREVCEGEGEGEGRSETVEKHLKTLGRLFKCLENVTYMNRSNQSYLVVFDGSLLVSKLARLIPLCQKLLESAKLRSLAVETLLGVMKVLLNLTHDNELGSHRVGEQEGGIRALLGAIFHLPSSVSQESQFDITVLALGLLINLMEHSSKNRTQLETVPFSTSTCDPTTTGKEDDVMSFHSNYSSLRALLQLFLKHHSKAEEATIEVPTPQRLSQLGGASPHQSPFKGPRELTPSFAARMRLQQGGRTPSKSKKKKRGNRSEGMGWLKESQESSSSQPSTADTEPMESESESEEEFESIPVDPLVFSREEFETALNQAGQHMEDSIVASYTALLLGILVKHNQDTVDLIRLGTPSKTFAEMIAVLRKFVSFMNITGSSSGTGLESIRHIIKYLEALDT